MRTRLVVGLAFATLGISAVACSSSTNPYAQVSEFCAAYSKAICQVSSTCQFDSGTCEQYQQTQCMANAPTATTTTRTYEPNNVQACINALNSAYGNNATSVSATTITNYQNLCSKVFLGNVGEGNACTTALDCANTGDVCASAPGGTVSKCVTPAPKQLNDPCADPGDECPANSYCAPQPTGPTCVAAQTNSQPCSDAMPCDSTTQCVAGQCQPLSSQGQPCTATTNCGQSTSGQPMFCDTYTDSIQPSPACVTEYTFARGSVDCLGIAGQGTTPVVDAGGSSSSGGDSGSSSGSGGDAGEGGTDAPSGG